MWLEQNTPTILRFVEFGSLIPTNAFAFALQSSSST